MNEAQWKTRRSGLLLFVGGCFLLPALLLFSFTTLPMLIDAQRMSSWPSTSATLESASLKTSRSDKSTQYKAVASYRYQVGSTIYSNNQVALSDSSDNIGDFQKDLAQSLRRAFQSGSAVPVYFSPSNPQDSVLNRDLQAGLVVVQLSITLIFFLVGGGLFLLGWRGQKINTSADVKHEPWKLNADWQGGAIYSNNNVALVVMLGFSAVWTIISWISLGLAGPSMLEDREPVGLVLVAFALVPLWLISKSIQLSLQWRRFGKTPLFLDPFPGQLGGVVRGYIAVNQMLKADSETIVNVVAMRVSHGRKNSTTTPLWQRRRKANVEISAKGCHVRFDIPIDNDLAPTDFQNACLDAKPGKSGKSGKSGNRRTRHYWQLHVENAASGLDRMYEIPVYEVAADQRVQSANEDSAATATGLSADAANDHWFGLPDVQQPAPATELPASAANSSDSLRMHFPLSHGIGTHALLTVFGFAFFSVGVLIGVNLGGLGWMFGSLFLLIGGLLGLCGLSELLTSKTVLFNTRQVVVSTRLFNFTVQEHRIEYTNIQSFKSKRSGSSSSGNGKHKIFYKVYGQLDKKKVINVAWMVEGDEAANGLSDYLNDLVKAV